MKEHVSRIKRSAIWHEIYNIIKELKLAEPNGDDNMDKPSCTTELEQLFNKLFITNTKSTKSF